MTINYGGGYPMMAGMNSMMNGMGTNMGLNTGMSAGSNYSVPMMGSVNQEFLMKYGCEDCFRKEPYPFEYPKPYTPAPKDSANPSFWQRLLNKIMG